MDHLYGFYYNNCIHESASELMSLHWTSTGAEKAMEAYLKDNPINCDWQVAFVDEIEVQE